MAGSKEGGRKARETLIAKYGPDFYARMGKLGGLAYDKSTSPPKGFAANPKLASRAGKKGGTASKRRRAAK